MGLENVFIDFFARAAAGAASVLLVIFLVSLGIRRRSPSAIRRTHR